MCNFSHKGRTKIPASGTGYKIMEKLSGKKARYSPPFKGGIIECNKFYEWDHELYKEQHMTRKRSERNAGFCFFLTKEEATRVMQLGVAKSSFMRPVIVLIKYEGGIGEHYEDHMFFGEKIKTAICKKFKIVRKIS